MSYDQDIVGEYFLLVRPVDTRVADQNWSWTKCHTLTDSSKEAEVVYVSRSGAKLHFQTLHPRSPQLVTGPDAGRPRSRVGQTDVSPVAAELSRVENVGHGEGGDARRLACGRRRLRRSLLVRRLYTVRPDAGIRRSFRRRTDGKVADRGLRVAPRWRLRGAEVAKVVCRLPAGGAGLLVAAGSQLGQSRSIGLFFQRPDLGGGIIHTNRSRSCRRRPDEIVRRRRSLAAMRRLDSDHLSLCCRWGRFALAGASTSRHFTPCIMTRVTFTNVFIFIDLLTDHMVFCSCLQILTFPLFHHRPDV